MRMEFSKETDGDSSLWSLPLAFPAAGQWAEISRHSWFSSLCTVASKSSVGSTAPTQALSHSSAGEVTQGHGDGALPGCRGAGGASRCQALCHKAPFSKPWHSKACRKTRHSKAHHSKACHTKAPVLYLLPTQGLADAGFPPGDLSVWCQETQTERFPPPAQLQVLLLL